MTAAVRSSTPNLPKTRSRYVFTVDSPMNNRRPISAFVHPAAAPSRSSRSGPPMTPSATSGRLRRPPDSALIRLSALASGPTRQMISSGSRGRG